MKMIRAFVMLTIFTLLFAGKDSNYGVGDTVSDFKLKNVDGSEMSLSSFKDAKGVIVIFDCNTCPFSRAYNDRIIALDKKYKDQGFPVIAINANDPAKSPGDSFEDMVSHAKSHGYTFPYLFDESQSVAKSFGATNTPHVFLLKKSGETFKVAYIGAIDNNARDSAAADKKYVETAIEELLANKPVSTTKTKAIGCGIKWKNV
jgi:peroxiredoxin